MQELITFNICRYHDYYCRRFDNFIFMRSLCNEFFHEISPARLHGSESNSTFSHRVKSGKIFATVKFLICTHRIGLIYANVSSAARVVDKKKNQFVFIWCRHNIQYITPCGTVCECLINERTSIWISSKTGENNFVIFINSLFSNALFL